MVDYLPPNSTINAAYVQGELDHLREIILKKRRIMRSKPFILLDNARPHTAKKVQELGFRLLNHPPYSPDRAIADFHLFGTMKRPMRGRIFSSRDEVIAAADDSLRTLPAKFWEKGLDKMLQRYKSCIKLKGEYVERNNNKEDDSLSDESDD